MKSPIIALPIRSELPGVAAAAKGVPESIGKSGAAAKPVSESQPSFSALITLMLSGQGASDPAEAIDAQAAAGQTAAVTPPATPSNRRADRTAKTSGAADANPNAAFVAIATPGLVTADGKDEALAENSSTKTGNAIASATAPIQQISLPDSGITTNESERTVAAAGVPTLDHLQQGKSTPHSPAHVSPGEVLDDAVRTPSIAHGEATPALPLSETKTPGALPVLETIAPQSAPSAVKNREAAAAIDSGGPSTANANSVPAPVPQQPAQAPPVNSPPPLAEQIHDQVSGQLGQLQQVGRVEAQLNLHPPELGRVQVHLALEDGRLNVRMVVQDDNAKRAIDQQMEPLRVRFAEMGVSVGQFDVRRDGSSANPEQQQAAEPSAQTLQSSRAAAGSAQKSYAQFPNADALVDVIA